MPLVDQVSWGPTSGLPASNNIRNRERIQGKGLRYEMRTGSEWVTISIPGITLKLIGLAVFLKLE